MKKVLSMRKIGAPLVAAALLLGTFPALSAESRVVDSPSLVVYGGKSLSLPAGEQVFAAYVVSATSAGERYPEGGVPENALGAPDCRTRFDPGFYSLGCRGELVLAFDDAPITDGPGPDLVALEVGEAPEPAELALSADGVDWLVVGKTSGGVDYVDLAGTIPPGEKYGLLRIRDLGERCYASMQGADIDAVVVVKRPPPPPPAAIAQVEADSATKPERLVLSGEVLFESGKKELKEEGLSALAAIVEKIGSGGYSVTVEGHSDSVGSEEFNARLSLARAKSVAEYLMAEGKLPAEAIHAEGFGESRPRGDNGTKEGRAANRRVEFVLSPLAK